MIGLEFLPWSNIKTVDAGLKLVQDAGSNAGGLIIDVWHTERGHTPPARLATVPRRYIVGVDASFGGRLHEDVQLEAGAAADRIIQQNELLPPQRLRQA